VSYERGASIETLRQRAAMLAAVRAFFTARGVLEVETPALSSAGVTDPAIESIFANARSLGPARQYLHTSPEFAMKRLLAAGSGDIYQLCRVFRDDELGRWHQPEFTLLEWYRVGWDEQRLMTEVAELIEAALHAATRGEARRVVRLTYAQAVNAVLGAGPDAPTAELVRLLTKQGIEVPAGLRHDAVLDLAFGTVVLASFDANAVTLVYDYPATQAALARVKPTTPPVAARFEAFCGGIELANGFHELNDAVEQRRRFLSDIATRRAEGRHAPPIDEELLRALPSLPDCAGVALGFDRLVALATGQNELKAVLAFAH
jgi:lysyl-tRNA synthetase class 2